MGGGLAYLGAGEDMRRDDFLGRECLPGVDEGGQDLAALLAFRCEGWWSAWKHEPEPPPTCVKGLVGARKSRARRTRHRRRKGVIETHGCEVGGGVCREGGKGWRKSRVLRAKFGDRRVISSRRGPEAQKDPKQPGR